MNRPALREDKTMAQLCQQYEPHPGQINDCKKLLLERAPELFDKGAAPEPVDLKPLHAKIGQQALELDFLALLNFKWVAQHEG